MTQTVISKGIFHGLPAYPQYVAKKLTAIVTGANGISGSAMIKVLSEAPERWEKIYALSRKPPVSNASNVIPIAVDFLDSPEQIAKILKDHDVKADYIYFASYIQTPPAEGQGLWSDTEKMEKLNSALLSNFLVALDLAQLTPKRFLLQAGGKYYGVHLGPTPTPMEEHDARHGIVPNFYFPQEDLLYDYSRRTGASWVVTRPGFILGAVEATAMNIVYPLSVYAAIHAHLGRSLEFPADVAAWDSEKHESTAELIAYHAEWALLTPEAGNQALNHADSSMFSFGKFWPILASWYHISASHPVEDSSAYKTITMPYPVPPRGFGGPGIIRLRYSFFEWSQKPEVQEAWAQLKDKYNLKGSPFENAMDTFGLLDTEIPGPWSRVLKYGQKSKIGVAWIRGYKGVIP